MKNYAWMGGYHLYKWKRNIFYGRDFPQRNMTGGLIPEGKRTAFMAPNLKTNLHYAT